MCHRQANLAGKEGARGLISATDAVVIAVV